MYYIVASDLDGTLLLPDHTLSTFTKETLTLMTAKGIPFVFATGRHHIDVAQIRDELGIRAFMITSNGARVHDTEGNLLFSHNLAEDVASELMTMLYDDPHINTHLYRDDGWFLARENEEEIYSFHTSVFSFKRYYPNEMAPKGMAKIYFTSSEHDRLVVLENQINARWGDRVNASFSLPHCLEVMAGGVSKGHALDEVVKLQGLTLQKCIAFGDGMNDQEMLAMVGKGCVMKNAHQRLKDALPHLEVIGTNAEEAVAHYLRRIFL